MKDSELRRQIDGNSHFSQFVPSKLIEVIEKKLNEEKHGYIKLAISKGKIVKISWEAGETIKEKN